MNWDEIQKGANLHAAVKHANQIGASNDADTLHYVVDHMLRNILGDQYDAWVKEWELGSGGEEWPVGKLSRHD